MDVDTYTGGLGSLRPDVGVETGTSLDTRRVGGVGIALASCTDGLSDLGVRFVVAVEDVGL